MNITVYLGSSPGNDPKLNTAVRALGRWIGESGHALVYGGSRTGLMGALAESTLQAGGEVTGVEVSFFVEQDLQYEGLTHFYVARDLPERRTKMIELGDAFIAFPGGLGTLEEISEVMSRVALHKLVAPCILYNLDGYYEGLRAQLTHMVKMGLCTPEKLENIHFAADLAEIKMPHQPQKGDCKHERIPRKNKKAENGHPAETAACRHRGDYPIGGRTRRFAKMA